MDTFWTIYFSMWPISISLTIWIIITVVGEILDLIINRKKVVKLIQEADSFSTDDLETKIQLYTEKLKMLDDWTKEEIRIGIKLRELDKLEKTTWRKRELSDIYWHREDQEKKSKELRKNYSSSKWSSIQTKDQVNRELVLHKIFYPE